MSIWKEKLIPLQILYPSSVLWKITPLYFFSSNNSYFVQKETIKGKIFETFGCSGQNLSNCLHQFWNDSQFLSKFCIPLQFHERWLLCTFLAWTIYTLLKRSPLKGKFLKLLSAQVKICQIPYVSFKMASWFLPKFCLPLQFHER